MSVFAYYKIKSDLLPERDSENTSKLLLTIIIILLFERNVSTPQTAYILTKYEINILSSRTAV